MRKKLFVVLAAVLVAALLVPATAFADTIKNKYPSWDAAVSAFLNDERYHLGANEESGHNCEQYAWDYIEFVYGIEQMTAYATSAAHCFYDNFSEIRKGDIVRFVYPGIVGHNFIVLARNGNQLETLEANWRSGVVERSTTHYSLSGNKLIVSDGPDVEFVYAFRPPDIYAGWNLDNALIDTWFNDDYMRAYLDEFTSMSEDLKAKVIATKPLEMLLDSHRDIRARWGSDQLLDLDEHYNVKTKFADVPGKKKSVGVQVITGIGQFAGSRLVFVTDVDVAGSLVKKEWDPDSEGMPDYYYDPNYYEPNTMREVADMDEYLATYIADSTVGRLAGNNALDTMQKVVEAGKFKAGGTVVLANAWGYHDALTAAGIAGLEGAPVVMTDGSTLSAQAKSLLQSLKPARIVVCGGTGAVSDKVVADARKAAGAKTVERAAGSNAAATAVDIYKKGSGWAKTAIVATSGTYHDALAAAPLSYAAHLPIFMTEWTGALSDATVKAMQAGGITQAYIAGGTYWIPETTAQQLEKAGIKVVKRLAGATAVETSSAIAAEAIAKYKMKADNLGVATTASHYDALAGAAFCGAKKSVMLLAADETSSSILDFMWGKADSINRVYIFGGASSVSDTTMKTICAAS